LKKEEELRMRVARTGLRIAVVIAVVMAISSVPAIADVLGTANINNNNNILSDWGTLYGDGYPDGKTLYTGIYSWTNQGGTGLGTVVPNWGVCIEIPQAPFSGWMDVLALDEAPLPPLYGSPMGITKANYIRELWGRDFDASWVTGQNRQMAEAFNVALFEILYETDLTWDVIGGAGFHVGADVEQAATANTWLNQLNGNTSYFANNLVSISTTSGQDFVVQVPEPASLFLLAAGAIAVLRKRSV
jgi:hypothetical protein